MPALSLRGIATTIFSFFVVAIVGAIISANVRTFLSKRGWDTYLDKLADHPNLSAALERCRRVAGSWEQLRMRWWLWLALGASGGIATTLWVAPISETRSPFGLAPSLQRDHLALFRPSVVNPARFYSAKNKEEVAAFLDKISDSINRADQGMLLPAKQVLIQRFLARPVTEATEYLSNLDGIRTAAKRMDVLLYDDLLANERDYRSEMNAILFPKEPFVNFMRAAEEYRNGISVWMKFNNLVADPEANEQLRQSVVASARAFSGARDEFVKWLSSRQDLINQARTELR
jgi:hypothetical protein